MIHPPARHDAPDETDPGSARNPRERLALCWLFPLSTQPPRALGTRSVIGRADDCDLCLVGRAVSRHHACIERSEAGTVLRDLDSTNGVFLNGSSIASSPVTAGDVLRIGNWVGYFTAAETAAENPGHVRELGLDLWGGEALARALEPLRAVAPSRLPITLVGESGTGKQLVARAVHAWSGRRGPFQVLNCASSSERHIVSELFGRRTRGPRAREAQGLLHAARGGTLLLEEASELSSALQLRLWRRLAGDLQPAESGAERASEPDDVRLILTRQHGGRAGAFAKAASDQAACVELQLPPLRQRLPEIPGLFLHFVNRYSDHDPFTLDAELVEALCLYGWPGNVRELEFLARQLVALHQGARELGRQHLPRRILDAVNRGARPSGVVTRMATARSTLPAVPASRRGPCPLGPAG